MWRVSRENRLKVFVVVIPKEEWARMAAPILLLIWHQLFRIWLCWHHGLYSRKVGVMPKEGWSSPRAPMTTAKTLWSIFLWCASVTVLHRNFYLSYTIFSLQMEKHTEKINILIVPFVRTLGAKVIQPLPVGPSALKKHKELNFLALTHLML